MTRREFMEIYKSLSRSDKKNLRIDLGYSSSQGLIKKYDNPNHKDVLVTTDVEETLEKYVTLPDEPICITDTEQVLEKLLTEVLNIEDIKQLKKCKILTEMLKSTIEGKINLTNLEEDC